MDEPIATTTSSAPMPDPIPPTVANPTLPVKRLTKTAVLPTRAHPSDAGLDLYADADVSIQSGSTGVIPTGIALAIPEGYAARIVGRSGLAAEGIMLGGGLIDSGYRGEIKVVLHNCGGPHPKAIWRGDRIAQLVVVPVPKFEVVEVQDLPGGDRGTKGFGSTGK